jgi:hypothetical protein
LDVQEQYRFPELSPDGRKAALVKVDAANRKINVWLMDLVRSTASRFTFGSDLQGWPHLVAGRHPELAGRVETLTLIRPTILGQAW